MTTTELMSWQTFKEKLQQHPELTLQFQYRPNEWVDASYHITEIKQAPITSVDCGGKMNSWTEVIVQLWEPVDKDSERAMKVDKALSIVKLVENSLALNPLAIVKIEFGNSDFDTRQMYPAEFIIKEDNLIVDLSPDFTQCKATGRGSSCGGPNETATKPKIQMVNLAGNTSCATDSGCC